VPDVPAVPRAVDFYAQLMAPSNTAYGVPSNSVFDAPIELFGTISNWFRYGSPQTEISNVATSTAFLGDHTYAQPAWCIEPVPGTNHVARGWEIVRELGIVRWLFD